MYKENSILVEGKKITYYEFGSNNKAVILMLSGFSVPCPLLDMYGLAKELSKQFRCIIIDRPGYGKSDIVLKKRDFDSLQMEVTCLLIKLNVNPKDVLILGHSLGAIYSLILSQNINIKGTVLLDFEKVNSFQVLITKLIYGMYYGICKTSLRKKYNNKLIDKLIADNVYKIPSKVKNEAIKVISEKIPNICIKNEIDSLKSATLYIKYKMKKRPQIGLFICEKKNEKVNLKLEKYFKNSKIISLDTKKHFIHYDYQTKIADEILKLFES